MKVKGHNKTQPLTIFISRALSPNSRFHHLTTLGHRVIGQSLLKFEFIEFALPSPLPQAIFFYSSRAIAPFLKALPYSPAIEYGVMGIGGQATFVELTGMAPEVVGSGDRNRLIQDIKSKWADKNILFPIAEYSLKSFEPDIQGLNYNYVTVYKNNIDPSIELFFSTNAIEAFDILVFTSPKNVESYLRNHMLANSKIFAIGRTTAAYIKSTTGQAVPFCTEPSEEALYEMVLKAI